MERIRIAESFSSVKRDLDILSSQLASNTVGRSLAAELRAAKNRLEEVNNDLVSLIVDNKNKIEKLQRVVGGKAPMTTNLDMGGYRILNVAQPRDPREYESDLVISKILYDYMSRVDQNYMRRDRDGLLDGRLNMSNHRIRGLADPTDADDAVTRRYVASRFQSLSDEVQGIGDNKRKLDVLQNLLGVENNQVLLMKYELMGVEVEFAYDFGDEALFRKYPHEPGDIVVFNFFMFSLDQKFMSDLFEEPVDDITELNSLELILYISISSILILFHLSYTQEAR